MVGELKQLEQNQEHAEQKRQDVEKQDMALIKSILNAAVTMDDTLAIEIISHPDQILGLIDPDAKYHKPEMPVQHNFPFYYAMHTLGLPLIDTEFTKILNQMDASQLQNMKTCISVALKRKRPNKDKLEEYIQNNGNNSFLEKQKQVFENVGKFWDVLVNELKEWNKIIDNFKPHEKNKVQKYDDEIDDKEETHAKILWSLQTLATKLHYDTVDKFKQHRNKVLKLYPYSKIWFNKKGRRVLFNSDFFEDFKKLIQDVQSNNKKDTQQDKPTEDRWVAIDDEWARKIGYNGKRSFMTSKSQYPEKYPTEWFKKGADISNKKALAFNMKYFEELQAILKNGKQTPQPKPEKTSKIKKAQNAVSKKIDTQEKKKKTKAVKKSNSDLDALQSQYDVLIARATQQKQAAKDTKEKLKGIRNQIDELQHKHDELMKQAGKQEQEAENIQKQADYVLELLEAKKSLEEEIAEVLKDTQQSITVIKPGGHDDY